MGQLIALLADLWVPITLILIIGIPVLEEIGKINRGE